MCASCGCAQVNEDHGDERHITRQNLKDAAEAADISVPNAGEGHDQVSSRIADQEEELE